MIPARLGDRGAGTGMRALGGGTGGDGGRCRGGGRAGVNGAGMSDFLSPTISSSLRVRNSRYFGSSSTGSLLISGSLGGQGKLESLTTFRRGIS